jgi:hypothetical protein
VKTCRFQAESDHQIKDTSSRLVEIRHQKFSGILKSFRGRECPVVYLGKIMDMSDGRQLIKIGSTTQLGLRAASLVQEYGSMTLFDVYKCDEHKDFKRFLRSHSLVKHLAYNEPVVGATVSHDDVFCMAPSEVETLIKIAGENRYMFSRDARRERLELLKCEAEVATRRAEEARAHAQEAIANLERVAEGSAVELQVKVGHMPEELRKIWDTTQGRRYTQARGDKVQRYSPDGRELLGTYVGLTEATRSPGLVESTAPPQPSLIRLATKNNTVYKGFRWALLDRSLSDDTHQDLPPTVETPTLRKGFVAMLDLDCKRVVQVFCDQKAAAQDRHFKSCAPICSAISKGTQSGGHRWAMWDDVDDALRQAFLSQGGELPEARARSGALAIQQLHPITHEVIRTFATVSLVTKEMRMSRQSVYSAIDQGSVAKGFLWRFAQE